MQASMQIQLIVIFQEFGFPNYMQFSFSICHYIIQPAPCFMHVSKGSTGHRRYNVTLVDIFVSQPNIPDYFCKEFHHIIEEQTTGCSLACCTIMWKLSLRNEMKQCQNTVTHSAVLGLCWSFQTWLLWSGWRIHFSLGKHSLKAKIISFCWRRSWT